MFNPIWITVTSPTVGERIVDARKIRAVRALAPEAGTGNPLTEIEYDNGDAITVYETPTSFMRERAKMTYAT